MTKGNKCLTRHLRTSVLFCLCGCSAWPEVSALGSDAKWSPLQTQALPNTGRVHLGDRTGPYLNPSVCWVSSCSFQIKGRRQQCTWGLNPPGSEPCWVSPLAYLRASNHCCLDHPTTAPFLPAQDKKGNTEERLPNAPVLEQPENTKKKKRKFKKKQQLQFSPGDVSLGFVRMSSLLFSGGCRLSVAEMMPGLFLVKCLGSLSLRGSGMEKQQQNRVCAVCLLEIFEAG